ncbi:MAG TPA: NAD(P)/FAD-dependent oxidoreductase [Alphaproteobacteria bacterium]|nr:NAD(P)/FAD-dependent oxidoreductase [Alphaproteobacteria bacterium]
MTERLDCVVVGAGVVGLAAARALALAGREVTVLERADSFGTETSSRNSEVIHAGIYYPPGSLKARHCVAGKHLLYAYCAERGIAHKRIGKIIVATGEAQIASLEEDKARAAANGVGDLEWLSAAEVKAMEPAVIAARGLLSPSTGIVDSHNYMLSLVGDLENAGGQVVYRSTVTGGRIREDRVSLQVSGTGSSHEGGQDEAQDEAMTVDCALLVNAAGLGAQALASALDGFPGEHIPALHTAIGHYFTLSGTAPFNRLVYPVPEEGGLGVHVTLDLAGQAKFGPDVKWIDTVDYSFDESRKPVFVDAIRKYYPGLDPDRLQPGYTGIRPKIAGRGEGFGDFRIDGPGDHGVPGVINLFGIESPGLTSALSIANHVAEIAER